MEKRIYEKEYISSIDNENNDINYWNNYNSFNGNVRWVKNINADDNIGFNNSNDIGENEGISYNNKSKTNDISEDVSTKKDTVSNNSNIPKKTKATEESKETVTNNAVDNSESKAKSDSQNNNKQDNNNDDNYDDSSDNSHEKVEYNTNEVNKESIIPISSSTNNIDTNFDNNTSFITSNKNIPNNSAIASVDITDDEDVNSLIYPIGIIFSVLIVIAIGAVFFVHKRKLNNNGSKEEKIDDKYSDEALLNVPNDDVIIGYTELLKNKVENSALKNYQNDVETTPVRVIDINVPEHTVTIENH